MPNKSALSLLTVALPAAVCTLLSSASTASALPFTPARNGVAAACLGTQIGPQIGNCSMGGQTTVVGVGLAQINNTFGDAGNSLSATASGNASFGVLSARALASFNIAGPSTNAFAFGQAVFTDVITIDFAPWNGNPGLLYVSYTLDGTTSSSGSGSGRALVQLFAGTDTSNAQSRFQNYSSSTSGVFSVGAPIQFVFGQPFGLNFSLLACAGGGSLFGCGPQVSGAGSATSDFFNTFVLSGLIPTDLNGNQAPGATFSSASGTSYSVDGVVPEPATISMAVPLIICLLVSVRRTYPNATRLSRIRRG